MKAIILAAGRGTRMKTFTEPKPKCLLNVNDKPILAYQLQALLENKIKDIVLVIGYKGDMIKQYVSDHPVLKELNITYIENSEYGKSDSSFSWWLAKNHIKNEQALLHFNSDLLFSSDLISKILECEAKNIICIDRKIKLDETMEQVVLDSNDNKILLMDKRNIPDAHGKGAGIAKYSNEVIGFMLETIEEFLKNGDKHQHFYWILRQAIQEFDFYGLNITPYFFKEINTIEDYSKAQELILTQ